MKLIFLWRILELILGIISSYIVFSFVVSEIPVNRDFKETKNGVSIYIMSNGVHTDIAVPLINQHENWTKFTNPLETISKRMNYNWAAFGWGDKGFYLATRTWKDLKLSVALSAVLGLNETAMHVTFYEQIKEGGMCKKVTISNSQYKMLVNQIKNQFRKKNPKRIHNASYGHNDSFYNAKGTYSLFTTCNTWANSVLKHSEIKACLWTPIDAAILRKH